MENFKSSLAIFGRSGFGRALAISLVLHAMLLSQILSAGSILRSRQQVAPPGNSVNATLRGIVAPLADVTGLPARPAATPGLTRQREATTASRPSNYSPPELAARISGPAEMGEVSRRLSAGKEISPPAASTAAISLTDEDGVDANGLRQYRLDLALESRRFKRYPRQALEQGWRGTAEVRIAVAATGAPQFAQLLSSSGHASLDAAALDMANNAALHAAVPASLRGQPFSVLLPISFDIDSE